MDEEEDCVPTITSSPELYSLEVLKYVASLPDQKVPATLLFLFEIESVCFALNYTCLCAMDSDREMIGYFRVPEDQRDKCRNGAQAEDVGKFKEMVGITIRIMADQGSRYHAVCAKLPPDAADNTETIEKLKEKFQAENVFRGPRLEDGRVRMIFQVPGTVSLGDLTKGMKERK